MTQQATYKRLTPLTKVVKAAVADAYEDLGRAEELYSHFACRGLRKLQQETLKHGKRSMLLRVSKNTNTATLPPDFDGLMFAGIINELGKKVPLRFNSAIPDTTSVEVEKEVSCDKCSQNKNICEDLYKNVSVKLVPLNGAMYEEITTKTLYPNGDYYLEKETPYVDSENGLVKHKKTRQFITQLSLKGCGCLEDNSDNLSKLQQYCPQVYAQYYCGCDDQTEVGSCQVFEETGVIGFNPNFPFDYVYIEYIGFLPKAGGQYMVPSVAFEALVEWTKFKAIQNKSNISRADKDYQFGHFKRERKNMERILGRVSLSDLIYSFGLNPRFSVNGNSFYAAFSQRQNCNVQEQPSRSGGVHTVQRERTGKIGAGKLEFDVDNGSSPISNGQTQLTLNDKGIIENTVSVEIDSAPIPEGKNDRLSYTVEYGLNAAVITINQPAVTGQNWRVNWLKNEIL